MIDMQDHHDDAAGGMARSIPPMDLAWLCLTLKSGDRSGFETGEAKISTERFQSKRSKRRTLHFLKMRQRKGQRLCLKEQPRGILSDPSKLGRN